MIQNAAARLITGTKNFEHKKPVLQDLLWLPVRERIDFKTALLVFKCTRGLAPPYLVALCHATSDCPDSSRLRSADLYQMYVPRTRTNYGDRSFSVNGPAVWNSLPVDFRAPDISIDIFKHQLKAFLFTIVYWPRICGLGEFSALQMSLLLLLLLLLLLSENLCIISSLFLCLSSSYLDLWPFHLIFIVVRGIKFGDFSFSRFDFIVRTDRWTDRISQRITDADDRYTHATTVGVSKNTVEQSTMQ